MRKEDESKTMPIKCEEYVNGHLSNSFMWFKVAARVMEKIIIGNVKSLRNLFR